MHSLMRREINASHKKIAKLRRFIQDVTLAVNEVGDEEPKIVARCRPLLEELVANDDWLPDEFATPDPDRYQQFLLYCDPRKRFSVVSFVWGPGQSTPVHDHTVWGLIGMLRGSENSTSYELAPNGTGLVKTEVMQLKSRRRHCCFANCRRHSRGRKCPRRPAVYKCAYLRR